MTCGCKRIILKRETSRFALACQNIWCVGGAADSKQWCTIWPEDRGKHYITCSVSDDCTLTAGKWWVLLTLDCRNEEFTALCCLTNAEHFRLLCDSLRCISASPLHQNRREQWSTFCIFFLNVNHCDMTSLCVFDLYYCEGGKDTLELWLHEWLCINTSESESLPASAK